MLKCCHGVISIWPCSCLTPAALCTFLDDLSHLFNRCPQSKNKSDEWLVFLHFSTNGRSHFPLSLSLFGPVQGRGPSGGGPPLGSQGHAGLHPTAVRTARGQGPVPSQRTEPAPSPARPMRRQSGRGPGRGRGPGPCRAGRTRDGSGHPAEAGGETGGQNMLRLLSMERDLSHNDSY